MSEPMNAIELGWLQLTLAAALILVAGGVSLGLGLRLERQLGLATLRTIVQLLLIGYVLRWIFALDDLLAILALAVLMVLAAARAAVKRASRTFRGVGWRTFVTLVLCGLVTTIVVTAAVINVHPWYTPQYLIPLLGMVLGNSLNAVSLCLDTLLEQLRERRNEIEMELSLGASRWEAARDKLAEAVRRGMIPIINAMMVVGIVSLPGMMTGQILAGADPLQAVKYQIVVMFMIAAGTSLACVVMVLLVYRRLFTPEHRLRTDIISRR